MATKNLEIHSTVREDCTVELSLVQTEVPEPAEDEVVIKIEAAPINPSDLGLLLAGMDKSTLKKEAEVDGLPRTTGTIKAIGGLKTRVGQSMPVGNEGAGTVVKAGSSSASQLLMGCMVGVSACSTYAQYRVVKAASCLAFPEGTPAAQAAAWCVNPLTALAMTEQMRMDGHTALVHTAAASNLGQMLVKLCAKDGIELVNVVRKQEQVDILKGLGAKYVVNTSEPDFEKDLVEALKATGATLVFDALGGGDLAGIILGAMEIAGREKEAYSRYGSSVMKQAYLYGGLDSRPKVFDRSMGMAWSVGGWLLIPFMAKARDKVPAMRKRVADEIGTIFASTYTREISLAEALDPETVEAYGKQATGEKYLITPFKGM